MTNKEYALLQKITNEYVNFVKRSTALVEETKRATVLVLKEVLKLNDGDFILIREDGSIEVNDKEITMSKSENESQLSEKLTLNGREISVEELEQQKEAVKKQKGAKLEEVSKGNFRLHLNG